MRYLEFIRIRGIPIRIHSSWFFILFLLTFASQQYIESLLDGKANFLISWGIGLITSLLLFGSIVLHELGHSFMALHEGIKVRSITLFLLGGVARIEKECSTAMSCLRVAIAGPLVNIFLACVFWSCYAFIPASSFVMSKLFAQLGVTNLLLALFNLLPGLPLDGGVILKAIVWHLTGSQRKGSKVANSSGRFLSLLAIFLGVFIFLSGGGLSGLWLGMLGWFGLASARSQNQIFLIQDVLCKLEVGQAAQRNFRVLDVDKPLKSISELSSQGLDKCSEENWILLCSSGRWVGYITDEVLNEVPVQFWDQYPLSNYRKPLVELPSLNSKDPLWKAVLALEKKGDNRILVFNAAGLPSGTLEKVDIGNLVLKQLGIILPKSFLELAKKNHGYPLGISFDEIVRDMIASGLVK